MVARSVVVRSVVVRSVVVRPLPASTWVLVLAVVLLLGACAPAPRPQPATASAGHPSSSASSGSSASSESSGSSGSPQSAAASAGEVEADPQALRAPAVRQGRHARVLGTMPPADLERVARLADAAVERVDSTWAPTAPRPWSRRLEVVAPATPADYDAVLGRTGAAPEPASVAALTTGPVGADGLARSDRIVLNPTGWARLGEPGRRYVLTHEVVHVAVRATVPGRAPAWLTEGFADHVAYAGLPTVPAELTRALREQVAERGVPADLPAAADLDPAATDPEAAYLSAWQAVEEAAALGGSDAPARLLRACSRHGGSQAELEHACAEAVPRVLGVSRAELVRRWQARLRAL